MAMMASGFNGQNFTFNGYLPIDSKERKAALKKLEKESFSKNASQIFIETPYRNNKMLDEICSTLHQETNVCLAVDITLPSEYIKTQSVKEWKLTNVDLHKRPAIFIIYKN
jgi:16S rRNA (cytidine1402-2'-O)-methyltransferase